MPHGSRCTGLYEHDDRTGATVASVERESGLKTIKIGLCGLIFAVVSAWVMMLYVQGPLNGDFDKHLMVAKNWGIPAQLQERGIRPLYLDKGNNGWDGQFYFYMANDLLARKDTAEHIDADAYRYQRIGIPLLAKGISLLLGQDWVSPRVFYGTQALLIFLATLIAAAFFTQKGMSPFWILPWSLAAGTQITLLNGLPDGGADALMIMALICAYRGRYAFYAILVALACLSREAYVMLPAILFAISAWVFVTRPQMRMRLQHYFWLALPGLVFVAWQGFIRMRFVHTPAEQSGKVLGLPLVRALELLVGGLQGQYPGMQQGTSSYLSGIGILLFLMLMAIVLIVAFSIRMPGKPAEKDYFALGVKLFVLLTSALYLCFGDTVMWNFTGYMKAADLLIFMVPFMVAIGAARMSRPLVIPLFCAVTVFFGWQALQLRVLGSPIVYKLGVTCGLTAFAEDMGCKEKFVWLGRELPSLSGRVTGNDRVASEQDAAGILTFGPYIQLPPGHYRITLSYSASGDHPGYMDVTASDGKGGSRMLQKVTLTAQEKGQQQLLLDLPEVADGVEIRVYHDKGELAVHAMSVAKE